MKKQFWYESEGIDFGNYFWTKYGDDPNSFLEFGSRSYIGPFKTLAEAKTDAVSRYLSDRRMAQDSLTRARKGKLLEYKK